MYRILSDVHLSDQVDFEPVEGSRSRSRYDASDSSSDKVAWVGKEFRQQSSLSLIQFIIFCIFRNNHKWCQFMVLFLSVVARVPWEGGWFRIVRWLA